jgi:hypothetical protein
VSWHRRDEAGAAGAHPRLSDDRRRDVRRGHTRAQEGNGSRTPGLTEPADLVRMENPAQVR